VARGDGLEVAVIPPLGCTPCGVDGPGRRDGLPCGPLPQGG